MFREAVLVGATGAVGQIMRSILEQREPLAERVRFLASKRSAGSVIPFRGRDITVEELTPEAFAGADLVIASTPDEVAAEFLPHAVKAGARVIDESGYFRMHEDVALVVPEVNPEAALNAPGLISSPNCSTTQLVMALKPLHDAAGVKRVICSTYQATSGAGVAGQTDLTAGMKTFGTDSPTPPQAFTAPIAGNLIPQIGSFKDDDYTSEELKMVHETRKILGTPEMAIAVTCVRAPVVNCHSEAVTVETERPLSPREARELLAAFPGVTVVDDPGAAKYPMPLDCDGSDDVFVGRIRRDLSHPNGLMFWCVSDNLRKGAATNAVQIAELLAKHV